jgi:chemotaxis signal transduction protein
VRHVADFRDPHPLPLANAGVLGLLAWLRRPIPVLDLAARLHVSDPVQQPGKVVVVGEPAAAGLGASSALAALAVHQIGSLHAAADASAGGSIWIADRHIRVLDLAELLFGQ